MSELRVFSRVDQPSILGGQPKDCHKCRDAKQGTILIGERIGSAVLCLDCYMKAYGITVVHGMAVESLPPDEFEELERILKMLCQNRMIDAFEGGFTYL